jgi:hypothetical protein
VQFVLPYPLEILRALRSCRLHRFRSSPRSRKNGIVVENGANSCVGRVKRDNSEKLTAMKPSGYRVRSMTWRMMLPVVSWTYQSKISLPTLKLTVPHLVRSSTRALPSRPSCHLVDQYSAPLTRDLYFSRFLRQQLYSFTILSPYSCVIGPSSDAFSERYKTNERCV